MKQATPEAYELEQDIQASLSAALDDLDKLELFAVEPAPPPRARAVMPKIPRGMPPLPHGRVIPPLPVARLSLVPRLVESLKPEPSAAIAREPVPVVQAPKVPDTTLTAKPRRWPGVAFALLALALLGAAWWWLQHR